MRIVKRGQIPEEIKREVECSKCHSILEYTAKDIKYEDRPCGGQYIKCPVCDNNIWQLNSDNGNHYGR